MSHNYYPAACFHINMDITRRCMAEYDNWKAKVEAECLTVNPDYRKLTLSESYKIRREVVKRIPCPV